MCAWQQGGVQQRRWQVKAKVRMAGRGCWLPVGDVLTTLVAGSDCGCMVSNSQQQHRYMRTGASTRAQTRRCLQGRLKTQALQAPLPTTPSDHAPRPCPAHPPCPRMHAPACVSGVGQGPLAASAHSRTHSSTSSSYIYNGSKQHSAATSRLAACLAGLLCAVLQ